MEVKYTVSAVDKASRVVDKIGRGLRELPDEIEQGLGRSFEEVNNDLERRADRSKGRFGRAFDGIGNAAFKVNQTVELVGRTWNKVTAQFADTIAISQGLSEVQTLLGDTSFRTDDLREEILALGQESGQSYDVLIKGLYDAVSAGVKVQDSMSFLRDASKLSVAGVTDISTAVDQLTSVMNAYGLEAKDMGRVNDAIFTAVKGGKTTVGELSAAVGRLAPIAKSAGVSIEEMYAAVATVTKGGISTNEAITGIRAALNAMLSPSEKAAKEMDRLGISISSERIAAEGLLPVLKDMYEKTGGNFEAMSQLVPTVEALPSLLQLVANGGAEFSSQMDNMANKAGAADGAFAEMSDEVAFKLQQLNASWVQFKDMLLVGVLPVIGKISDALMGWFEMFGNLKKTMDEKFGLGNIDAKKQLQGVDEKIADIQGRIDKIKSGDRGFVSSLFGRSDKEELAILERQLKGLEQERKGAIITIQQEVAATKASLDSVNTSAAVAQVHNLTDAIEEIPETKSSEVNVEGAQAVQAAAEVKASIDAIPDVSVKTVIVEYKTKASPVMPFSEGIEKIRRKMESLPTGQEFVVHARGAEAGSAAGATFNASITVNAGGGADGKALARDMERELAHRWKTGRSQLRVAMETR